MAVLSRSVKELASNTLPKTKYIPAPFISLIIFSKSDPRPETMANGNHWVSRGANSYMLLVRSSLTTAEFNREVNREFSERVSKLTAEYPGLEAVYGIVEDLDEEEWVLFRQELLTKKPVSLWKCPKTVPIIVKLKKFKSAADAMKWAVVKHALDNEPFWWEERRPRSGTNQPSPTSSGEQTPQARLRPYDRAFTDQPTQQISSGRSLRSTQSPYQGSYILSVQPFPARSEPPSRNQPVPQSRPSVKPELPRPPNHIPLRRVVAKITQRITQEEEDANPGPIQRRHGEQAQNVNCSLRRTPAISRRPLEKIPARIIVPKRATIQVDSQNPRTIHSTTKSRRDDTSSSRGAMLEEDTGREKAFHPLTSRKPLKASEKAESRTWKTTPPKWSEFPAQKGSFNLPMDNVGNPRIKEPAFLPYFCKEDDFATKLAKHALAWLNEANFNQVPNEHEE
jgi:hypothetical protein